MTNTCQTCRFNTKEGECRRYPPVTTGAVTTWPLVRDPDWCGEHRAKSRGCTPEEYLAATKGA